MVQLTGSIGEIETGCGDSDLTGESTDYLWVGHYEQMQQYNKVKRKFPKFPKFPPMVTLSPFALTLQSLTFYPHVTYGAFLHNLP